MFNQLVLLSWTEGLSINIYLSIYLCCHYLDGCDPKAAIEKALNKMESRVKGYGGAIAISHLGQVGYAFTTQRMAWASVKDGLLQYGLDRGQCCEMRVEAGHGRDSHMIDNAPA